MSVAHEIKRRRTFAIISHPDAGKTTLTEKFLLYGGAINLAGSVRDRKNARDTASDWMELEKQRGISISSTVMQFEYRDCRINLLDTPGHRDFSEDTYRVLTAVDAAVMVLDAAKGIEDQTRKLFEVCRQRGIPIFTFINKCDRPGKEPLALLDEIEETLGLKTFAVNWPLGDGPSFQGVFDRIERKVHWFERVSGGRHRAPVSVGSFDDPAFAARIPADVHARAVEELELLEMAGASFDDQQIFAGHLTPVYFGSAVNNFGVQLLLDGFLEHAPPPQPRKAGDSRIDPTHEAFSGFVFKIQANMDPKHRDRLVFIRICSGKFRRDQQVIHAQSGRQLRLSFSHQLFGRDRETQDEAFPGDILGVTGLSDIGIGDTLTENPQIVYDAIPQFAPECFAFLHNTDTQTFKRFRTGLDQLLQEKVAQRYQLLDQSQNIPLLGAVGPLQFDVVKARIESEYNAKPRLESAPWSAIRWVDPTIDEQTLRAQYLGGAALARDSHDRLVILFADDWSREYFERKNDKIRLHPSPVSL